MAQPARQELLKDPVIARVRDEVRRLYGDRLVRLVLYGSRARGDADAESDYDFAVFLDGEVERDDRILELSERIFEETGAEASLFSFPLADLSKQTLYMEAVRQEGVPLISGTGEGEMEQARKHLGRAKRIASVGVPEVAAREAYSAARRAAQVFIFERTGKVVKTHGGVHGRFSELWTAEGGDRSLPSFLGEGFGFKQAADYADGDEADAEQAAEAIASAARFIEAVEAALKKD
jgi:predicted nucleotidyltransferase/uncharacterized protein (UPF0332 family)